MNYNIKVASRFARELKQLSKIRTNAIAIKKSCPPRVGTINFYTAQSKIIISTKPAVKPNVGILLCGSACDSGISSSTTTYIIAPAAKAKRYGKVMR